MKRTNHFFRDLERTGVQVARELSWRRSLLGGLPLVSSATCRGQERFQRDFNGISMRLLKWKRWKPLRLNPTPKNLWKWSPQHSTFLMKFFMEVVSKVLLNVGGNMKWDVGDENSDVGGIDGRTWVMVLIFPRAWQPHIVQVWVICCEMRETNSRDLPAWQITKDLEHGPKPTPERSIVFFSYFHAWGNTVLTLKVHCLFILIGCICST